MISSGYSGNAPDGHLVFINYLYGIIVASLYKTFLGVEWYTLLFCIIHIFSLSCILYMIVRSKKDLVGKIVFGVLLYVIELRIIVLFQFTTTAALCAFTGLCLLLKPTTKRIVVGMPFFLLGTLIRFDAAMLVSLLIVPLFLYKAFVDNSLFKTYIWVGCVCLFVAFSLKQIDVLIYSSNEQWYYYKEYNEERGKINDNPNVVVDYLTNQTGMSKENLTLLTNFLPDPTIMTLDEMKQINHFVSKVSIKEKLQNIYPSLRRYTLFLTLLLILYMVSFFLVPSKRERVFVISYFVFYLCILAFISLNGTLKYRVFITTLFPLFGCLYVLHKGYSLKTSMVKYVIITLFISIFGVRTIRIVRNVDGWRNTRYNEQLMLITKCADDFILPFAADYSIDFINPFEIYKQNTKIVVGGWMTANPLNQHFCSYYSLLQEDMLFFCNKQNLDAAKMIELSMEQNYNIKAITKMVDQNDNYAIIKFTKE
ncbi:MAG TPA: hypothetical protein PKW49_10565 [Paludibacteraceae bacterium]|nr:hypothetical protein [Paludibacteraceae bacterium]